MQLPGNFFIGSSPFIQDVQHLSALSAGLFHQSIDRLTRCHFVRFVFDVRQVNDDVVAGRLDGRLQAPGRHLKKKRINKPSITGRVITQPVSNRNEVIDSLRSFVK